jgi:lipopolysaccharide export system protein LptC
MSSQPVTSMTTERSPGAKLMVAAAARIRRLPTTRHLARRHILITLAKFVLPALALVLLASIALWPEFDRAKEQALQAFRRVSNEIEGAQLIDARYHGVDEKGRPYTLTAATAQQAGPERFNLTTPKGDITLEDGTWLMLQSKQGVFIQHTNQLDLSHDVTLYRDDGTTLVTDSASIDLKNGAAAGAEPVHAEGPFGTLDAQGGFTLVDKGSTIQFAGPAHLVLNGASSGRSPAAPEAGTPSAGSASAAPPPSGAVARSSPEPAAATEAPSAAAPEARR